MAIVGILIAQLLWTKQAFSLEEKKFSQKAHIAMLEVAKKLYQGTNHDLPAENPVKKIANDYYIVNIDNDFEPEILEFYLKTEFAKSNILTDFEFAVYNCQSDEMVYGGYFSSKQIDAKKATVYFPKHKNLVYYFAIRFPNQTSYLLESFVFWLVLSGFLTLILLLYCYSIYTLLQQKKYADLQRDFVNNMTHEFKTPLTSILIASQFLKNQSVVQSDQKLSKYSQIIIDQGKKLDNHIDKILNLSRSDAQPFTLDISNVELIDLLNQGHENIKMQYENIDLRIINDTELQAIFIETDPFHFLNMISNLLENGIKYNKNQPVLQITLSLKKNQLLLAVSDNGIGIAAENKAKIFYKFVRLFMDKTLQVKGFGLGLFYVKNICKLQKWKISVYDNYPTGSIFCITIPFKS